MDLVLLARFRLRGVLLRDAKEFASHNLSLLKLLVRNTQPQSLLAFVASSEFCPLTVRCSFVLEVRSMDV